MDKKQKAIKTSKVLPAITAHYKIIPTPNNIWVVSNLGYSMFQKQNILPYKSS